MKKESVSEVCMVCRYSVLRKDLGFLTCNRYAPSPTNEDDDVSWPVVNQNDWCGEFKSEASLS